VPSAARTWCPCLPLTHCAPGLLAYSEALLGSPLRPNPPAGSAGSGHASAGPGPHAPQPNAAAATPEVAAAATAQPVSQLGPVSMDLGGPKGEDGASANGGSHAAALAASSVWHRICADARGALTSVASEARDLKRAAVAGIETAAAAVAAGVAPQRAPGAR
jgi:hypothetical protein